MQQRSERGDTVRRATEGGGNYVGRFGVQPRLLGQDGLAM